MYTTRFAPGVAKFLLNWPTTDVNITNRSGKIFVSWVRLSITEIPTKVRALVAPTWSKTNSCSSNGVKSKRCWWKGEPLIPA
jgi:hypothetical protein